jgi:hypothetical protein
LQPLRTRAATIKPRRNFERFMLIDQGTSPGCQRERISLRSFHQPAAKAVSICKSVQWLIPAFVPAVQLSDEGAMADRIHFSEDYAKITSAAVLVEAAKAK